MKKLLCSIIIVAVAGYAGAELFSTPTANADFESGMSGWGTWGSGSGSGSSGVSGWHQNWAFIDTTGNGNGGSQNFMNTSSGDPMKNNWWGWGYNVIWRSSSAELLDWSSSFPGLGLVSIGAYFKDLTGSGGSSSIKFEWIDFSGGSDGGGSVGLVTAEELSVFPTTTWAYYSFTLPVPLGSIGVRPVWGSNSAGGSTGIDDVSAMNIPEPMSIALLSIGGLFLRRRK